MQINAIFTDALLAKKAAPTLAALARKDMRAALHSARALFTEHPEVAEYAYILSEALVAVGRTDDRHGRGSGKSSLHCALCELPAQPGAF
jgi:hypothetical protein